MWTKYYLIKLQINNNELKEAKRGFEQLIKDYPDNKKLKSKYKEIFK